MPSTSAAPAPVSAPLVQHFTLRNGMELFVRPDHRARLPEQDGPAVRAELADNHARLRQPRALGGSGG